MASDKSRKIAIVSLLMFQVVLVGMFSVFVSYDPSAHPLKHEHASARPSGNQYPLFQDIQVMIFVGFGFMMTFLKKYAYSSLGFTFLIAVMVIQWGLLVEGFIHLQHISDHITLNLDSLIGADIVAAVVLISFGAVLGKISPIQLLIMAIAETLFFAVNEYVGQEVLKAADVGGSVFVHTFGAYFGLSVSFVLSRGISISELNQSELLSPQYQNDINCMLGTLFLWVFWPSFNAGLLEGDEKERVIINTYLSLVASCWMTFAVSAAVTKEQKFNMAHIQNATLAGGVCVGTASNMMIYPYGALLIGCFAGALATIGYRFVQGLLMKKFHIHDTCGIHNLHGMPGIAAGLIGAIMAGLATEQVYGPKLYELFPGMTKGTNRAPIQQAGVQLVVLGITLVISTIGGLITGLILKKSVPEPMPHEFYNDSVWWYMEEEEKPQEP